MSLKDAWEAEAERWALWARTPNHDVYPRFSWPVFRELLPPPGRRTLDIGCGEGDEAARVLEPGGRFCFAIVHPIQSAGRFEADEPESPFSIAGADRWPHSPRWRRIPMFLLVRALRPDQ